MMNKINNSKMRKVVTKSPLTINYTTLFNDWINILHPILTSTYFANLYVFINEVYKSFNNHSYQSIFPIYRSNVFSSFKKIKYDNVRVVILAGEPITNNKGTGIPYANTLGSSQLCPELEAIRYCIKDSIYKGEDFNFDQTLLRWMDQGVLLLHSTLTSEKNYKNSHELIWREFTRNVLNLISENKRIKGEKIIFVFWGKEAKYFKKYIDLYNHYALFFKSPSESLEEGKIWDCPHFKQINNMLKSSLGQSPITW